MGTYSEGNLFVVYDIRRHVLPTAPSPTTTHLQKSGISFLSQVKRESRDRTLLLRQPYCLADVATCLAVNVGYCKTVKTVTREDLPSN